MCVPYLAIRWALAGYCRPGGTPNEPQVRFAAGISNLWDSIAPGDIQTRIAGSDALHGTVQVSLGGGFMHPSRSLHVDSYEALTEAMADFHDERFDLDSMAFDADQRCWSGRFYLRVYDDARTTREHSGVENREYLPVVECTLRLYNV